MMLVSSRVPACGRVSESRTHGREVRTLMIRFPGKLAPSRHMVDPQSPLFLVSRGYKTTGRTIPEVGDDLVTTISYLLVLLWGSLGDLETILGKYRVTGIGASANLTAVQAMTKDLDRPSALCLEHYHLSYHLRWLRYCRLPHSGHCRTYSYRKAS